MKGVARMGGVLRHAVPGLRRAAFSTAPLGGHQVHDPLRHQQGRRPPLSHLLKRAWRHAVAGCSGVEDHAVEAAPRIPTTGGDGEAQEMRKKAEKMVVRVVDMHTEGEPLRVVVGGLEHAVPADLEGDMLARRRWVHRHRDHLRTALMWEPRGHRDMYGCLLFEPCTPTAHVGVLFLHNEGYSSMCGHGIIAMTKLLVEAGIDADRDLTNRTAELRIDSPAGLITAQAHFAENGKSVERVSFTNVPSYAHKLDVTLESDAFNSLLGKNKIRVDIGFGGAFYAYVSTAELGLPRNIITSENCDKLKQLGVLIKKIAMQQVEIKHPLNEDLSFLYGTIIVSPPHDPRNHSRNVCIFADGEIDRSPTGTGVSGRLALLYARKELQLHRSITIESIIGTSFNGMVKSTTRFGPHDAILPQVSGTAFVTGRCEFVLHDPNDPLRDGFLL